MELVKDPIAEIIRKHLEFKLSLKTSVHLAIEIGEDLKNQKDILPQGSFTSWIDENFPFTVRTAQNYMKLYEKKDLLVEADPANITEAYLLISPKKEKVEIPEEEEKEDDELVTMDAEPLPHNQVSIYDYWDHLGPLIQKMDSTYNTLSRMRDSTTPIALGSMIGNIKDMANVLVTWSPDLLKVCNNCSGEGCEECVEGLTGLWKRSEN